MIIRFPSRPDAESFKGQMMKAHPETYVSVYLRGSRYVAQFSGSFADEEIRKLAQLAGVSGYNIMSAGMR